MDEQCRRDIHFMREALAEAMLAFDKGEVPVGAIVEKDGCIVGRGHNMRETWADPTAHAEIIAIRQAAQRFSAWRLTGCTLYVTIEPCLMCAGAIILGRIDRLVYGADDPKAGAVRSLYRSLEDTRLNHQVSVQEGVLAAECADLMRRFFRRLR
ncbi:MAG: tRNA adenosine(34) deaminase TadA [Limnochordia bacterium]